LPPDDRRTEKLNDRASDGRVGSLGAPVLLAAALAVMGTVVWRSLGRPGDLTAWDGEGHLLKAVYLARHLLPHGMLTGWFPLWHGGFDLFQCYPPLFYYLLGPLTLMLQPELALRLATALLWIGLLPVTYYFLRSFGVRPLGAALGAATALALDQNLGVGLGALYGVGLLPNGLGILLAIGTLGRLERDLADPGRDLRHRVVTGLWIGLLLLAHTFTSYWWAMASLILALTEAAGRSRGLSILGRYAAMLAIAGLVSAYWWVPLILNLRQMAAPEVMVPGPRLEMAKAMLLARDGGGPALSLLAILGLGSMAATRRFRHLLFFGAVTALSFLLGLDVINRALPFRSVVGSTQFMRFQAFFACCWSILAGFGLAQIAQACERLRSRWWAAAALAATAALLYVLVLNPSLERQRGYVGVVANAATAELDPLSRELRRRLRPGDFILSEFNWGARFSLGSPHFVTQRLPLVAANVWDLEGNYPESTRGATHAHYIASVLGAASYVRTQQEYLASRGVRFIVTCSPDTRSALADEDWLAPAWQGQTLALFELTGARRPFGLPIEAAAQVSAVSFDDRGRYRIAFRSPVTLPAGTSLALSHHPWLRAESERGPIAVGADAQHRLELAETARDVRSLTIAYRPPPVTAVAGAVSWIAWITALLWLAWRARHPAGANAGDLRRGS
jgi:hypothetical protein